MEQGYRYRPTSVILCSYKIPVLYCSHKFSEFGSFPASKLRDASAIDVHIAGTQTRWERRWFVRSWLPLCLSGPLVSSG